MRAVISSLKILAFVLLCIAVVPIQIIVMLFTKGDASRVLPRLWMKAICFIYGIKIHVEGEPRQSGQVIRMSNHLSYLDIPVIGSIIPDSFVSKADVAQWPVFGFLAGLRQTAYVVRGARNPKLASQGVENRLRDGDNLIIFPEGTSTDGRDVIDFKTGVFSRAIDAGVDGLKIQPMSIHVIAADKRPIETQDDRDLYAWHRDMDDDFELTDHLWRFGKSRGVEIRLTFHDTIDVAKYDDRKTLAKATHNAVSNGLKDSIKRLNQ